MKALIYQGPMRLAIETVEDPTPGPGEAVIQIRAAGVCGSDVHAIGGSTGRRAPGMILGHEGAGEVLAVGPTTGGRSPVAGDGAPLRPGERVAIQPVIFCGHCAFCEAGQTQLCPERRIIGVNLPAQGVFADFLRVPTKNVYHLAPPVSDEAGALVEPLAVGLHAARLAQIGRDQAVLVTGAGTIGLCTLLCCRFLGAGRIFVTDPLPHKRDLAGRLGGHPIDTAGDVVAAVQGETGGMGADVAIDAVGSAESIRASLAAVQPDSDVVQVGMHERQPAIHLYDLVTQERRLLGSYAYSDSDFRDAIGLVNEGRVDITPLIEGRVPLGEAVEAILALCRGESNAVKVVVYPNGGSRLRN